jgi:CheY-like chemotaxis protein
VKAEAANRFKDQILANVSHEMRTPLNGILGYTDMVLGTNLTEEQREHLRTVQASGKTLVDIIEDLLDFAALESGQMNLQPEAVSLAEVVEQTMRSVRYEAESKGLKLTAHLDSGLPAYVRVDVHRLRQILLNLLGNAVKFSTEGHVRITVGTLNRPSGGQEAGWQPGEPLTATFVVSDEGQGIPSEHLATIFEPFQQVDGSRQRRQGGAGLGLAIVKRIADALSGCVRAQSEVGKGSRFVVTLPLNSCAEPASRATSEVPAAPGMDVTEAGAPPLAGANATSGTVEQTRAGERSGTGEAAGRNALRKVLIAEDNPVNQTLLVKIMKTRGLHVVAVGNGQAAVDAAQREHFDLILMDIQMPVMDGIEATRMIRNHEGEHGSRIPIIAVTANGLFQCRQECLEVGMDGYVVKPFGPATLFEAIKNVSQGRGSRTERKALPAASDKAPVKTDEPETSPSTHQMPEA